MLVVSGVVFVRVVMIASFPGGQLSISANILAPLGYSSLKGIYLIISSDTES